MLNQALLRPGERVCVAVSGGADSTALLLALHEQSAALAIGISAVHLHHGLRGAEADADLEFLRELCARLDVPLRAEQADVAGKAKSRGETLEEAARHARLQLFTTVLAAGDADAVATAHTEDDQAETVMMKLIRGAWTEGLGGISPVLSLSPGRVIRPMLGLSRAAVVRYLQERGQPWREDSTNAANDFTRNRVRHSLMPLLREFNPRIAATLSQTAEIAREEETHWHGEIARLLDAHALPGRPVRGGGRAVSTATGEQTVAFELERLRLLDLPSRRRLLRLAASRLGTRLNSAETMRLLLLAGLAPPETATDPTVPSKPNSRLQIAGGLLAERSVRELRLTQVAPVPKAEQG